MRNFIDNLRDFWMQLVENHRDFMIVGGILTVLLAAIIIISFDHDPIALRVTIYNRTDQEIDNLYYHYAHSGETIAIEPIKSGSRLRQVLKPYDNRGVSQLNVFYYDDNGDLQYEIAIGYFIGKGMGEHSRIYITDVDENGIYTMEIEVQDPKVIR